MELEPIYLDNHLLVLMKPAGILAQADDTGDTDFLTMGKAWLKREFQKPGNVYLGLVHRLDRPVSGLMVFARTSKAATRLTRAFKDRQVEKRYLALVQGKLSGSDTWADFLMKDDRRTRVVTNRHPKGKLARLSWQVLATHQDLSLVDIELHTGRAHQIRVQFASRGHALLGDFRYGCQREFDGRNLALHSYRLGLEHPVKKVPLCWWAAPPQSWRGFFERHINLLLEQK